MTRRLRVVLLGANGQLGQDIGRAHAADAAFDLVPIGREELDVSQPDAVERQLADLPFDALVNCTGYHKTDEVEDNATGAIAINAHAVESMARVCARKGARLLHISTDYVFGGDIHRQAPLSEDVSVSPVNVYGSSKALGETLSRLVLEDLVILRVASLFGVAGASGKGGNFVETMIRGARQNGTLRVVDDQRMSPTATADVAEVVCRMLPEGCPAGTYHLVNSGSASWWQFAKEIVGQAGLDAEVLPCGSADYPTRARRPSYSVLDNAKAMRALGPLRDWRQALGDYLVAKGHKRPRR